MRTTIHAEEMHFNELGFVASLFCFSHHFSFSPIISSAASFSVHWLLILAFTMSLITVRIDSLIIFLVQSDDSQIDNMHCHAPFACKKKQKTFTPAIIRTTSLSILLDFILLFILIYIFYSLFVLSVCLCPLRTVMGLIHVLTFVHVQLFMCPNSLSSPRTSPKVCSLTLLLKPEERLVTQQGG